MHSPSMPRRSSQGCRYRVKLLPGSGKRSATLRAALDAFGKIAGAASVGLAGEAAAEAGVVVHLDIPTDLLPLVYQYSLHTLHDLSTVSLVCREWRRAARWECGPEALGYLPEVRLSSSNEPWDYLRLSRRVGLRLLKLPGNVDDASLSFVCGLRSLVLLDLSSCNKVTDAGLVAVGRLTKLEKLNLSDCPQIGDVGLRSLAGLVELRELNLTGLVQVTDKGVACLSNLAAALLHRRESLSTRSAP